MGFSGPVTFSAPVENVAPARVVLSGESCFDELPPCDSVFMTSGYMLNEFFELVQHDEAASSGN